MSSEASNSSEEVVARGYLQQMNIDDSYQQTRTGGWGFMARKKNLVAGVPWQKKSGVPAGFRYSATDFVSCSSFSICSRNSNQIVLLPMRRLFCPLYLYNPTRCYVDSIEQPKIRLP